MSATVCAGMLCLSVPYPISEHEPCNTQNCNVTGRYVAAKFGLLPSEKDNLRVFEDGVLSGCLGPREKEGQESAGF